MPDPNADDTIAKAGQGANWFVGLSGAAIGGALAKLELVERFPRSGKIFFVLAAGAFLVSIGSGIYYFFQLLTAAQAKEKVDRELARTPQIKAELDAARKERDQENAKLATFHWGAMLSFPFACLMTWFCLICVMLWGLAPDAATAAKPAAAAAVAAPAPISPFTLVTVPVHEHDRLLHDHTFLLNQQTGAMWLMTCQPDKSVEFRRVKRLKLDGTPEAEDSAAAAGARP